jgi:hypothetical protein
MQTSPSFTTPALGTPSAGVLTNCTGLVSIIAANEAADTTCFPAFFTAATGELGPKTNAALTFNSSTGALAATTFVGALTGNADTVTWANEASDTSCFIGFATAASGSLAPKTNANMTFNSSTGVATFGQTIAGSITGNAATVTVANEATDTSCFLNFTTDASGSLAPKTNANMTFNSNTGVVTFASSVLTTTDINGGTVDGAIIGGASPAAGTFTSLVASTTIDFGAATSLEIPHSAAPTVNEDGEIAIDDTVTDFAAGVVKYFSAVEMGIVAMPVAQFTSPTNGAIPTYVAANDRFEMTVPAGTGDVVGPGSATDLAVTRFDGTTGKLLQNSGILLSDTNQLYPASDDAGALGIINTNQWSDLFFATGAVINFANSNATITHSSGLLTFNVPITLGTSNAFTCGTIELGAASDTTVSRAAAGVIAVEGVPLYSNTPVNSQSAAYTTVLADAQKFILHPTADNNARTFTIDSNANVAYPIGTCLTFVNQINTVTISITADTLTLAGAGTTGSRTLVANGTATALKIATTEWVISGVGLS